MSGGAERAARRIGQYASTCAEYFESDEFLAKVAAIIREETGTQWIPVVERLPGMFVTEKLLVAHRQYEEPVKGHYIHGLKEWRIEGSNSNMNDDVYAWQELPALPAAPDEGGTR